MKALVYHRYGSPDLLKVEEVPTPTFAEDQVLVRVRAAAVNPLDRYALRGTPFLVRLRGGLLKPTQKILGADIAGRVEAVGKHVTRFQPGDEVFGLNGVGGFAEYVAMFERRLEHKPAEVTFAQAAAVPVAAFTAVQALRDHGQIQAGHRVLINGAAGGVGTFAVQIAKAFGAVVTGVCSTRNLELVRSIGADQVIDYTEADFTRNGQRYDLIVDTVANRTVGDYKRALTPEGNCVIVGYSPSLLLQVMLIQSLRRSKTGGQRLHFFLAKGNQADLALIKGLLETGKVVPVIDREYPLREGAEALHHLETGRARGKVVITM